MADKVKGTPSKVTFFRTENKMVLLKRRGSKQSRIVEIPADGDLTKVQIDGRLVNTVDLDESQTIPYEDYIKPAAAPAEVAPVAEQPPVQGEVPAPAEALATA